LPIERKPASKGSAAQFQDKNKHQPALPEAGKPAFFPIILGHFISLPALKPVGRLPKKILNAYGILNYFASIK